MYLINRFPSHSLKGKVPFEVVDGHSPDLDHLKVFGYLGYVTCFKKSDRFSPRVVPAVFLGYSLTQKGYKMYTLHEKEFIFSRHVVFKEDVFPFQHLSTVSSPLFPVLNFHLHSSWGSGHVPSDNSSPVPDLRL